MSSSEGGSRANGDAASRQHQVLSGIRVLDLSRFVAGEFATKLFADFGADVVKIEKPGEGSLTRSQGPFPEDVPHPEKSALFLHLNTNKRSMTLNLASITGRDVLLELVARSDVLVESFRPGTMERLGLGWEDLRVVNPKLVMTRISNFGQTGPYRDWEATSIVLQAMGGPMFATGGAERPPLQKPGQLPWYIVGRTAGEASLAALWRVRRAGIGTMLDISAQEVLLAGADRRSPYIMTTSYSGTEAPRGVRSAHRGPVMPTGPHPCRDGFIMLYVTAQFMQPMLRLLGDQSLIDYFSDAERALRNPEESWKRFFDVCLPWLLERDKHEIMRLAEGNHIPITAIMPVGEVLAHPHYRSRGLFVEADHPAVGPLEYIGPPWRMENGWELRHTAPLLGEHTSEVLAELDGRVPSAAALRAEGIV